MVMLVATSLALKLVIVWLCFKYPSDILFIPKKKKLRLMIIIICVEKNDKSIKNGMLLMQLGWNVVNETEIRT